MICQAPTAGRGCYTRQPRMSVFQIIGLFVHISPSLEMGNASVTYLFLYVTHSIWQMSCIINTKYKYK